MSLPTLVPARRALRIGLPAAALAAATALYALPATAAHAATAAVGDPRAVSQPSIPSTCSTVSSTLANPSSRTFSSSQETAPPDTARIQSALNSCAGTGKAVVLAASGSNTAFLAGPLTIGSGVYLVVNGGVTLYASRDAANYQVSGSSSTCGTIDSSGTGCKPFVTVSGSNSGVEATTSSSGTHGIIDGRGDLDMYGTSTTWWALAGQAASSGKQNNPRLIQATGVSNLTFYGIDLINAAKQHIYFKNGSGLTVWGIRIKTPATARNTDGIDIDGSSNATVNLSYLQDGDDGVAIEANSAASSGTTVENSHFYGTHGISIGSPTTYGVSSVNVVNNTLQGTDSSGNTSTSNNGIRVKSYSSVGGTVSGVVYQTTCMKGIKYLIDIDPFYSSTTGTNYPYFKSITINGATAVSSASSAKSVLEGYSATYPLGLTLENISFDATSTTSQYAKIGEYNENLKPSGTGVTVSTISGSGSAPSCSFPSFPAL
jgi:polygalacturonase